MKAIRLTFTLLAAFSATIAVPATNAADFSIFASYLSTDDYDEAVGAGFRVAFFDHVQLELGAAYYDTFGTSFDFDLGDLGFQNLELELDVIPVDIGFAFRPGNGAFYLAGGGTLYLLDSDIGNTDDEFGLYARVGARFGEKLFLEGGYRNVEGTLDEIRIEDIGQGGIETGDADYDLSGYFVNLGWTF
jgi:hypothetical protein